MAEVYGAKIYGTTFGNGPTNNYQHLSASASATSAVNFVGPVAYSVSGDLGGGTVSIRQTISGSTQFVPIAGTSTTVAVSKTLDFPPGVRNTLKTVLLGGAAASCDIFLQGASQS